MKNNDVEKMLDRSMTVGDVIEALKRLPKDAPVGFISPYGDYHKTMQFLNITDVRTIEPHEVIETTAYSNSGLRLRDRESDDESASQVVVILE
jgi:hypothetical protein